MTLPKVKYKNFLDYIKCNKDRDDPIGDYCKDTLSYLRIYPPKKEPETREEFSGIM
jgi:hypothetical protein